MKYIKLYEEINDTLYEIKQIFENLNFDVELKNDTRSLIITNHNYNITILGLVVNKTILLYFNLNSGWSELDLTGDLVYNIIQKICVFHTQGRYYFNNVAESILSKHPEYYKYHKDFDLYIPTEFNHMENDLF